MTRNQQFLSISSLCAALSACYLAPMQPPTAQQTIASYPAMPLAATRRLLSARLYPANDPAATIGMMSGTIVVPEIGRGEFSLTIDDEFYQGEATRDPDSTQGKANAWGNRNGYLKCEYSMRTPTLGSGFCKLWNGAWFDIHIGPEIAP